MNEKKIVVKSSVTVKKSPDLRKVQRKAVAGLSEAELIERNTIGEYEEGQEGQDDGGDKSGDAEDGDGKDKD